MGRPILSPKTTFGDEIRLFLRLFTAPKMMKSIHLQNDFGDDFGDRQNVDPPMSDEYVAHFGSVDAELSGPRILLYLRLFTERHIGHVNTGGFVSKNDFWR